jgi:hypothetical protein
MTEWPTNTGTTGHTACSIVSTKQKPHLKVQNLQDEGRLVLSINRFKLSDSLVDSVVQLRDGRNRPSSETQFGSESCKVYFLQDFSKTQTHLRNCSSGTIQTMWEQNHGDRNKIMRTSSFTRFGYEGNLNVRNESNRRPIAMVRDLGTRRGPQMNWNETKLFYMINISHST